jgi:hypothetical protein
LASGASPAHTASACIAPLRLRRRNKPRMSPWRSSAARPSSFFGLAVPHPLAAVRPPAPRIRHLRRDTASAGYRLLVSLASAGA